MTISQIILAEKKALQLFLFQRYNLTFKQKSHALK